MADGTPTDRIRIDYIAIAGRPLSGEHPVYLEPGDKVVVTFVNGTAVRTEEWDFDELLLRGLQRRDLERELLAKVFDWKGDHRG